MNTQILSKLAAFTVALMMNGLIIVGVNYLSNVPLHQYTAEMELAQRSMNMRVEVFPAHLL
jgi:hypothetical protein